MNHKLKNDPGDMKKIISLTLLILIVSATQAISEATYSAFTKEGKALINELTFLNKREKFRIIFFTDKKKDYQIIIKTKNNESTIT